MPVDITATYNSVMYNEASFNGAPGGKGWQYSFNQHVKLITDADLTANGYKYIYVDQEGTEHYLKKDDPTATEWTNEDLGLTLIEISGGVTIEHSEEITQTYQPPSSGGKILLEEDKYTNKIDLVIITPDIKNNLLNILQNKSVSAPKLSEYLLLKNNFYNTTSIIINNLIKKDIN